MSMIKRFLEDYVEASHPGDYDAQDRLMEAICEGSVTVPLEEMQRKIEEYRTNHPERVQTPPAPG
jgi:hypothetical protein